ncbi:MAG: ABC transporter ATP-binding protein, partial [Actinomycetes bacterium]
VLMSPDAEILDAIEARKEAGDIPQAKPALVGTNLDVSLGQVQVLFGVDLEINAGEIAVLMGNNGAGKTTTLRTLSGLQSADLGAVLIDGFDVTGLSPAGRAELGLSLVVGGRAVFGPLTVRENLELFGYRLPQSREEVDARIATVVAKFPWIGERANQLASTLSGGEQQMLAVSQALIVRPKVLVIDEFSLGLAPKIVGQLIDLVREIAKQGTAVLLVEQSASVALDLADRIYLMERGRIVFNETGDVARANPERLTQMYLQGSQVSTS